MTTLRYDIEPTPIGPAVIAVTDDGMVALELTDAPPEFALERVMRDVGALPHREPDAVAHIVGQLREYFAGERLDFDVEIDWRLTRGFARAALRAVCEIPYAETASYGEVAIAAGAARAARAVGTACAHSPFSIVVPVHRVVRADGSLGEYGRHPEAKRFLVELERENAPRPARPARPGREAVGG